MEKKISVIPYLSFKGNCEEAVNTYINAFGGEILFISRWNESNFEVSREQVGKVPHPEPDDDGCGSVLKDRFGFTWIITCPNQKSKSC